IAIFNVLPFEEGRLPVKYLGVPLVSSRLLNRDCKELVEKSQDMRKGQSKVAWEVVCLPKDEGGLGLRRLDHFNKALMVSHIWKLLSLKESLWVKWVHAYKLKGRSFWDVPLCGNMSWGWREIYKSDRLLGNSFGIILEMELLHPYGMTVGVTAAHWLILYRLGTCIELG
ncbi:hypothetical protein Tco_0756576, partial [Tanacetum coccineum]